MMSRTLSLAKEHTDLDRLRGIAATLRDCEEELTADSLGVRFFYETGRQPDPDEVAKALAG